MVLFVTSCLYEFGGPNALPQETKWCTFVVRYLRLLQVLIDAKARMLDASLPHVLSPVTRSTA